MNAKSTTTENKKTEPWAVQEPYLTKGFDAASGLLDKGGYTGDRVAQFTPDQLATFQQMLGVGRSSPIPGTTENIGTQVGTAGANSTVGALGRLGAFSPTGGTQSNIDAATSYADAASSPAAVDAVMRDARRQVSEGALPQIARSAAAGGNALSSRRGISEGIVERGLAEKAADVSAGLRSDAFSKGLTLAEGGRQADNAALLDAIKSGGALGTAAATGGVGALSSSIGQQGSLFDFLQTAGAGQRSADQAALDNDIAKSESPWDQLMRYWSIVGSNNWGSQGQGTSTTESSPSAWSIIGSLMSGTGSLLKSDRNVKHDIKRIGTLDNGLPVYSFKYKHIIDSPTFIGLMAQDVEQVRPEAVRSFKGVKHVNYDLATRPLDDSAPFEQKWTK